MVRLCRLLDLAKQASMKIAILSAGEVSSMYAVTLIQRGHEVMFGPRGSIGAVVLPWMCSPQTSGDAFP
jgi:hypothetical protein